MAIILSDDLLARIHLSEAELRTELAVWLYQTGRLSMGKAAEVAELPKFEFQHLLAQRQIPVSYGPEEFARDVETVAHFGRS